MFWLKYWILNLDEVANTLETRLEFSIFLKAWKTWLDLLECQTTALCYRFGDFFFFSPWNF